MSCRKKLNLQLLCKQKLLTNCLPCLCKMTLHFSAPPHDVRRVIRSPANGLPECYICCCRLTLSNERIHCSGEHSRTHNRTLCSTSLVHPLTRCVAVSTAGGSLPVCAGCRQRIYDEQYLQALNTDWHTICFRYV